MINNNSLGYWNRLQAKSIDAQFVNEMVSGLNCSPFEAEAIVEKVHEIYTPLSETSLGLRPGQIQSTVRDASVAPNVPLAKAKQRLVTLTLLWRECYSGWISPDIASGLQRQSQRR